MALALVVMGTTVIVQNADSIYRAGLMVVAEKHEYPQTLGPLKTEQERERFRHPHRGAMQEQATEQGVALPEAEVRESGPCGR